MDPNHDRFDCSEVFFERKTCPFCKRQSGTILAEIDYHKTAEANFILPNIHGKLFLCTDCGVAYPSHLYNPIFFSKFYQKTLTDLDFFDRSFLQVIRKRALKEILRHRDKQYSFSTLLDAMLLHSLQVPYLGSPPQGLRVLDVGCGFGEFSEIFSQLGNEVVGTEIIPWFAERLQRRGLSCFCGELENIDFTGRKFDLIFLRATFYRTRNPAVTLRVARELLAPNGEMAFLDPSPGLAGVEYFFRKQFPQGQFYIVDEPKYFRMIRSLFGLKCHQARLIYGRPKAPLRKVRLLGNFIGLGELLIANLLRQRPYMMAYNLSEDK